MQDMKSSFQYRPGPHDTQVHLKLPQPGPDLVALYTFDEGQGYTVHDTSGHGHDLIMAEEPEWMVSLFLLTSLGCWCVLQVLRLLLKAMHKYITAQLHVRHIAQITRSGRVGIGWQGQQGSHLIISGS